jgi:chemotaxis protein MotB
MSAAAGEEPRHEIIIVKHRGGDHDEGHHGGVWKIAFADFMTAMMCFFLVMWLINAANEQTKAAVASYFNPVKLIDRNSSRKGLEDLGDGPHAAGMASEATEEASQRAGEDGRGNAGPATEQESSNASETDKHSDEHLFSNPYAVLAEIAAETGLLQNISAKGDGGMQTSGPSTGASGGEAYRDPFAPDFWSQQVATVADTAEGIAELPVAAKGDRPVQQNDPATDAPVVAADTAPLEALAKEEPKPDAVQTAEEKPKPEEGVPSAETVEAADTIRQELAHALKGDKLAEGLTVVATDEGVKISVTDQFDFGMFEIGSAVPRRELVLAMEKIGKTLAQQEGAVTLSGHTDAHPFKSAAYDNWRLSTARAHSAYYMLARAGLAESRITEVAGHADRELKNKADPFDASNRRIEILLDVGG